MRLAESSDCLGGERSQLDTLEMVSGIPIFENYKNKMYLHIQRNHDLKNEDQSHDVQVQKVHLEI